MKLRSLLITLMAGSITLSACSPEQINQVAGIANQLAAQLQTGNKATIDLQGISASGQTLSYGASDVEGVEINGKPVSFNFNAEGELEIDELDLSQGGTAEAQVKIKEMDQPVKIGIDSQGQQRDNIRLRARIPFAKQGRRQILMDNQAKVERKDLSEAERLARFKKRAVVINLGAAAAAKLENKTVMGAWLDGDRLPLNHFKLTDNGKLLINGKAFAHLFFGYKGQQNRTIKAAALRNSEGFKKKKNAFRQRVKQNKGRYVRTETTVETTTETTFEVQQFRRGQRPGQRPGQHMKKQRPAIRIGNRQLTPQQASRLRGMAAAKLAQDNNVFRDRTLYLLVKNEAGQLKLHKFIIQGDKLQTVAETLKQRIQTLQERIKAIKERLKDAEGDPQEVLEQISSEIEAAEDLNAEGEISLDAEAELEIEVDSEDNAEDIVEKEEIETELSEELEDELEGDIEITEEEFEEVEASEGESESEVIEADNVDLTNAYSV